MGCGDGGADTGGGRGNVGDKSGEVRRRLGLGGFLLALILSF